VALIAFPEPALPEEAEPADEDEDEHPASKAMPNMASAATRRIAITSRYYYSGS
jgi:hypothetical protein